MRDVPLLLGQQDSMILTYLLVQRQRLCAINRSIDNVTAHIFVRAFLFLKYIEFFRDICFLKLFNI